MLEFLAVKQVGTVYVYTCYVSKAPHLSNVEILILYVVSNEDCKFAMNLFSNTSEPSQTLIYSMFYWKCRFEMALKCLIFQETS